MLVDLVEGATAALGARVVRAPDPARDAVDGVLPGAVIEPDTPEGLAAALAWASSERRTVVFTGAGTKRRWGRVPSAVDVLVGIGRLNRLLQHQHGDLVATVEAGARLRDVNAALARAGQWLPIDPPFAEDATVGGLIATNDSGPWRHRSGTPRDLLIGIQIATASGSLARAGGQVVKNVAGYDLARVMSGSFGSLAAIVSATFKLAPLPETSATLRVAMANAAELASSAHAVLGSQLEPAACEIAVRYRPDQPCDAALLLRFAGIEAAVSSEVRAAETLLADHLGDRPARGPRPSPSGILTGADELALWRAHDATHWAGDRTVVRLSWKPADLERAIAAMGAIEDAAALDFVLAGRAGVGAGLLSMSGPAVVQGAAIEALRRAPPLGHLVIVRAPLELKQQVDVWGPPDAARRLMNDRLKRAFDPAGVLGAHRGPL
jgi:glycolate oxidase FAD binding subunit